MKILKNIYTLLAVVLLAASCTQTFTFDESANVPTPTPTPNPTPNDKELTSAPYAVGDYYYDGVKEGVVFEIWDNGNSGKIVSMTKSSSSLPWSSDADEQKRLIGADSETDGAYNMAVVKAITDWESKYPAFKWCADLGESWYLPATQELIIINNNKTTVDENLIDKLGSDDYYWSSTENDFQYSTGEFSAWYFSMHSSDTFKRSKSRNAQVRAVATFGDTPAPEPEKELTSAPYAVGDYYYDGVKEGVVFEIWDNGNSGKIVSMTKYSSTLKWSSDADEQKKLIGADSDTDGAYNMAVVKAISGWESKYPAFKWCADLGESWYLPAKQELLTIYNNKTAIDANLTDALGTYTYWSSTESDGQSSSGVFCAWGVSMYSGNTSGDSKYGSFCVRAVSAF